MYVDRAIHAYGRMVMCHMIADDPDELHAMADRIGVARRWFQISPPASFPHYDVCKSKRALAVAHGAVACERDAFVVAMRRIRSSGTFVHRDATTARDRDQLRALVRRVLKDAGSGLACRVTLRSGREFSGTLSEMPSGLLALQDDSFVSTTEVSYRHVFTYEDLASALLPFSLPRVTAQAAQTESQAEPTSHPGETNEP